MCGSASILVADDDRTVCDAISGILRIEGYDCDCASDGLEAARKLRESRFDLLIADLRMPGNEDLELVRKAGDIAPGMPVILVTAYPTVESASEAVRLPVVAYLPKPFDAEELLGHVRKWAEHSEALRKVSGIQERLTKCVEELAYFKRQGLPPGGMSALSASLMPVSVIRILAVCLSEMLIIHAKAKRAESVRLCDLLDCPQRADNLKLVQEAIEVLRRTKGQFKSRELSKLRQKLEAFLERPQKVLDSV